MRRKLLLPMSMAHITSARGISHSVCVCTRTRAIAFAVAYNDFDIRDAENESAGRSAWRG